MAENEVAGTHIINILRCKSSGEFIVIREILIPFAQYEKRLYRIQVIFCAYFIFKRCKGFIERIRRHIADASSQDIAYAQAHYLDEFFL